MPPMAVTWRRFKTAKFGLPTAQQLMPEEHKGAIRTLVAATRVAAPVLGIFCLNGKCVVLSYQYYL